jgi:hypothetical protein
MMIRLSLRVPSLTTSITTPDTAISESEGKVVVIRRSTTVESGTVLVRLSIGVYPTESHLQKRLFESDVASHVPANAASNSTRNGSNTSSK